MDHPAAILDVVRLRLKVGLKAQTVPAALAASSSLQESTSGVVTGVL